MTVILFRHWNKSTSCESSSFSGFYQPFTDTFNYFFGISIQCWKFFVIFNSLYSIHSNSFQLNTYISQFSDNTANWTLICMVAAREAQHLSLSQWLSWLCGARQSLSYVRVIWFGLILFGLVWFGLVRFGIV